MQPCRQVGSGIEQDSIPWRIKGISWRSPDASMAAPMAWQIGKGFTSVL
ncbi:hypothetical protein ALP71_200238 [Pseudomonas coronafaciens pv. garcae]|nr:hypothetical protein ALP71_200238 [Pseudomonas coronafaciens pv. garcae]